MFINLSIIFLDDPLVFLGKVNADMNFLGLCITAAGEAAGSAAALPRLLTAEGGLL